MKTLVIADRRPKINIKELVEQQQIELVIALGDLVREDLLQLEYVDNIPKIGVYGQP